MLTEFFLEVLMLVFITLMAIFSSQTEALIFGAVYLSWHLGHAWRLWWWLQKPLTSPFRSLGVWQILVSKCYHMRVQLAEDAKQLTQLEQVRRDFVANISHELRTPLTVLHGYVETLLDDARNTKNVQDAHILTQMQVQTMRMEQLVHDLLLLSRLENVKQNPDELQPVALAPLLQHICMEARALSGKQQHQIIVEVAPELELMGEPSALHSAFSNLVFNAVRYSSAGKHIWVRAFHEGKTICVQVKDEGIGIAAKHLPRLTERFYRVDASRSRELGGTGLGLAIVKHVLLRHNAHLEIQSTINEGSTFTCVFAV